MFPFEVYVVQPLSDGDIVTVLRNLQTYLRHSQGYPFGLYNAISSVFLPVGGTSYKH